MKRCGYTIVVHQHRGFNYGWSSVVVGSASKVMAGCGWSCGVGVKLWLVLGGGNEIMTGRVVVGGGGKIMADRGWSWVDSGFSSAHNQSYNLILRTFFRIFQISFG